MTYGFHGRLRPIISIIEKMIIKNDPTTWRKRVDGCMYRLTTANDPTSDVNKELFHCNIFAELLQVLAQVEAEPDSKVQGRAKVRSSCIHHLEWISVLQRRAPRVCRGRAWPDSRIHLRTLHSDR